MVEVVEEVAVAAIGAVVPEIADVAEAVAVEPSTRLLHRVVEAPSILPDRVGVAGDLKEAEAAFVAETAVDFAEGIGAAFEEEMVAVAAAVEAGPDLLRQSTRESLSYLDLKYLYLLRYVIQVRTDPLSRAAAHVLAFPTPTLRFEQSKMLGRRPASPQTSP